MSSTALSEPIRYGKYTLYERLGAGGMAEVFLARQDGAGGFAKKVVIKRILGDYANDATFVDMFLAEARLAAHLSHPNIVQIFDMGQEADTFYIAMEYVAGPNLLHLLRYATLAKDPRPQAFAKITSGIAEGLYYAHNSVGPDGQPLKIVHRDINPPNVIVSTEGIPKICDFGVAKSANRESTTGSNLKGKYTYMAPEQIKGEKVDHRADLFSLGVVLFETTTNKRLFKRDTELQVLNAVLSDPIPRPSQIVKGYPERLEEIVMWCLERDREKRCPDARTLHNALEEYLRQDPQGMTQVQLGEWVRSVLPQEVRDQVSGQYGFFSLPGAGGVKDVRTPTGWTPAGAGAAKLDKSPSGLPPPTMTPSGVRRARQASQVGPRPAPPGSNADDATQAGTTDSFSVVDAMEAEPSNPRFSVPQKAGFPWKWVGVGAGVLAMLGVGAVVVSNKPEDKPKLADQDKPAEKPEKPAAKGQDPEEAAKFYTDEAKKLIEQGKFSPAASLVAKAKELKPSSPATNVAITVLEEEAEVGARMAAAKQALADNDLDRASSLAKLVLDKEPTQAEALALLKQVKAKQAPAVAVRPSKGSSKPGQVNVDAPPGSRVYVDDEPVGQAPISRLSLASGRHKVEVRRDGFRPEVHEVVIASGKLEQVVARMDAKEEVRVALAATGAKDVAAAVPSRTEPRREEGTTGAVAPQPKPEVKPAALAAPAPEAKPAAPAPTPTPAPTPAPAPAPAAPVGELFAEGMTRPVKVSGDEIRFSAEAIKLGVSGLVLAQCGISAEGDVHSCKVLKAPPEMSKAVVDALQSWKMKPATLDGKPVALRSYTFKMQLVAPK